MVTVLVLYYSEGGATEALAQEVVHGIESVPEVEACLRTVPPIRVARQADPDAIPERGAQYVTPQDVQQCSAIALGSPIHFGQMASPLQHFFEENVGLWLSGALMNKPAAVFASGGSMHGGQESVLLGMMVPLLHHGALICGIPYSEGALNTTDGGGTPYGASRVGMGSGISQVERDLARAQGQRLARWALQRPR